MQTEVATAQPLVLVLRWEGAKLWSMDLRWAKDCAGLDPVHTETGRQFGRLLDRYVAGEAVEWPMPPLAVERLGDFQRRVLEALRAKAPHGRVLTYGELATLAGSPGAARAVGRAMATNPWSMVFP